MRPYFLSTPEAPRPLPLPHVRLPSNRRCTDRKKASTASYFSTPSASIHVGFSSPAQFSSAPHFRESSSALQRKTICPPSSSSSPHSGHIAAGAFPISASQLIMGPFPIPDHVYAVRAFRDQLRDLLVPRCVAAIALTMRSRCTVLCCIFPGGGWRGGARSRIWRSLCQGGCCPHCCLKSSWYV